MSHPLSLRHIVLRPQPYHVHARQNLHKGLGLLLLLLLLKRASFKHNSPLRRGTPVHYNIVGQVIAERLRLMATRDPTERQPVSPMLLSADIALQ